MTQSLIMTMSGIRGVVGNPLTPSISLNVGIALGKWLQNGVVVIGGDTRTSHDTLKGSLLSGLLSQGIHVIDIGRVTTPTLQQAIRYHQASAGVMITASHNPAIWSGIKLMNNEGSFLTHHEYDQFIACYHESETSYRDWQSQGQLSIDTQAIHRHVDIILNQIDVSPILNNPHLSVLVDANHGAGSVANPILLDKLGIRYTMLYPEPTGVFAHDPEPLEKNVSAIQASMKQGNYTIGFVQDADADRLVILDETGHFIGEDYSLAFCVDHVLEMEKAHGARVVVNLSTSNILHDVAAKHGASVIQTKVGESHVTQGIRHYHALVGGEGNGGVIYPKIGWGRDSLVGMVLALRHCAIKGETVSQIVSRYPKYKMIRHRIDLSSTDQVEAVLARIKTLFPDSPLNCEDGVKVTLPNGWLHARPSNTEPIIRIFVEADQIDTAQFYLNKVVT